MTPPALNIYIIHYTKLVDRKAHMMSEIVKWDLSRFPLKFEEGFDQESMTGADINSSIDLAAFQQAAGRQMKKGEQSLSLKYKAILRDVAKLPDDEYVLILEDDVIFKEDPASYISAMLKHCETENIHFDCVFMGEAWIRANDNRNIFFKKDHPATNGLCTVLYKVSSAKRLLTHLEDHRVSHALDWHFNYVFEDLSFNVYWSKAITRHGSVAAIYDKAHIGLKSVLRDKY